MDIRDSGECSHRRQCDTAVLIEGEVPSQQHLIIRQDIAPHSSSMTPLFHCVGILDNPLSHSTGKRPRRVATFQMGDYFGNYGDWHDDDMLSGDIDIDDQAIHAVHDKEMEGDVGVADTPTSKLKSEDSSHEVPLSRQEDGDGLHESQQPVDGRVGREGAEGQKGNDKAQEQPFKVCNLKEYSFIGATVFGLLSPSMVSAKSVCMYARVCSCVSVCMVLLPVLFS